MEVERIIHYMCFGDLWWYVWRSISSSPGRRVEFVVAVVVLLSDLWRRTDYQDTTLQCSCATAGGKRLRRKWERDSALHCQPVSQWVFQPEGNIQQQYLHNSSYHPCRTARLRVPHGSLEATFPICFGPSFRKFWPKSAQYVFSCSIKFQASHSGCFSDFGLWILTWFYLEIILDVNN